MTAAGGLVLCGGRSTRMGRSKAMLPFGAETMLERVVRLLGEVVNPVLVVASPHQELPASLAARPVHDEHPGLGPLEALRCGLSAISRQVGAACVVSCDAPLLEPDALRRLLALRGDRDCAVLQLEGRPQPFPGVYERRAIPVIEALLSQRERRVQALVDSLRTRCVDPSDLRDADPGLRSWFNVNDPDAYRQALAIAFPTLTCDLDRG